MTYTYRAYSVSERMSGIPRSALLDLLRHHVATSLLARPCPAGHLLVLGSQSLWELRAHAAPWQGFLGGQVFGLGPKRMGLTFQTLSCNKVKVLRQELRLWGIIQLLCCNIKCSKPLHAQNRIFFFYSEIHMHICYVTTTEKNEIVGANFKSFAEGILHLTQILRKQPWKPSISSYFVFCAGWAAEKKQLVFDL